MLPLYRRDSPLRTNDLSFFFELFFFARTEPGRRTQRLAVIEQRQIAHVQRQRARRRLLVDDDRHRAALDAFAERDAATAGEPRVCEILSACDLHHITRRVAGRAQSSALISRSKTSLPVRPVCVAQIFPSREITTLTGMPTIGPYASCTSS